ncbi:alanine/glycine transport protein [Klebsiella michiganensis]|nr:alanine/glycine transport protein [Klebsiella michiganensis]
MPDFLSFINEILWGSVMIYLLLGRWSLVYLANKIYSVPLYPPV